MTDFGAIFAIVSRGSSLALELYKLAGTAPQFTEDLIQAAHSISNFSSAVKNVGTIIRVDDTHISSEAVETLEDITDQSSAVLNGVESILFDRETAGTAGETDSHTDHEYAFEFTTAQVDRLHYLEAHLNALRSTVVVLQQTLYTAEAMIWARVRPSISPQQAAAAVANEKIQLENDTIEQQLSILSAAQMFQLIQPDARLLMGEDSTGSLVTRESSSPKPADLHRYQERYLGSLGISETSRHEWLPAVCGQSRSHSECLLKRWTRLDQINEAIENEERKMKAQKQETQQASVESDNEEDSLKADALDFAASIPRRPGSVQPLFTESSLHIPVPMKNGSTVPLSPASLYGASPRTSGISLPSPSSSSPMSPQSAFSIPVEAAAAVEAKDNDDDIDLEIPWKLRTRKYYWKFVDGRVQDSNTHLPSSEAFADRNSWTEIMASWVCKEAIKEQRFPYRAVQKDQKVGRRTKFETCFCIEQPLTFDQIQHLVERTVEIYRSRKPATPPPSSVRRSSFNHQHLRDKDKTPLAVQHPPLDRSISYAFPPPPPPPTNLERTISLPVTPRLVIPTPKTQPFVPQGSYPGQRPPSYAPLQTVYSPSGSYPPYINPNNSTFTATHANFNCLSTSTQAFPPRQPQPLPYRTTPGSRNEHYFNSAIASDSDSASRRRHRSRSRRSSTSSQKKHSSGSSVGRALALGGGLAALLDGVLNSGVL